MAIVSTPTLHKITIVVLAVAIASFASAEIHKRFFVPRQQQQAQAPLPTPTKDWNAPPEGFREPLPSSHYYPSDEEIVEGIVADSKTGQITLRVDSGQLLTFYIQPGYFLAASENSNETIPLVGRRMRIYYEERDSKLYIVFGERLNDEETL